ncbi:hypothetical protein N431DRAFT_427518 [Stipitochalara longipes BDJ]|nr:hypothetical protein N431DRAFT_427518 [Stipitochalara longipes BDJ]
MNGTVLAGGPDTSTATGNNFTRTSMIGMFIALQLCQLTQPYGSILFRDGGGSFWRCNPISSFTEACIIFFYLGRNIFHTWRRGRGEIMQGLQLIAGALLLLRAANADEDAEGLLDELLTGNLLDSAQDEHGEISGAPESTSREADIGDTSIVSMSTGATPSTISWQPSLESGNVSQANNHASTSKIGHILHAAFGNNALARRDFRIDLFTAFTEVCVIIKMLAIRGNGWFSAAGMLLVLGWIAVQNLLIVLHAREMEESEMIDTVRMTARLDKDLLQWEWWWDTFFLVLHLPFFGYPCYLISFHPWISPNTTGFLSFLRGCGWFLDLLLAFMTAKMSFWATLFSVFIGWCGFRRRRRFWKTLLYLALPIMLAWLCLAAMSHSQQICGPEKSKYCIGGDFKGFFSVDTNLHRLVDQGYEFLYKTLWLLFFLVIITVPYVMLTVPDGSDWDFVELLLPFVGLLVPDWHWINSTIEYLEKRFDRRKASLGNAIFVLVVFIIYLVHYDVANSYQPEWTSILG